MRNRGRQYPGDRYATVVNAQTINYVTNVTNVTHVTKVSGVRHEPFRKKDGHAHGRGKGRGERPPKLLRFYASCGLLDRDVVARMGNDEMMEEGVKLARYGAKGLASNAGQVVGDLAKCAGGLVKGVFTIFGAFVNAWK